ncbi:MAG: hypothetical protein IJ303_01695, partial [Clostridia bacterium]|nr:hypothetical protein [Clostridia bacterium]
WIVAAVLHEAGHFFAARLLGVRVSKMTLDVTGAKMQLCGKLISYEEEFFIAAAGPFINFIFSGALFSVWFSFAEFSLLLGILNMMPAPGFDGYRMTGSLIALFFGTRANEKAMHFLSFCAVIFLWTVAVYTLIRYNSGISLFVLSCALFTGFVF